MTITIAWERRLPRYSEIVFCSDSRLTGGGNIDVCQKIFPLPREDAAIGFCGSTLIAYPVMNQMISYIRHYKKNIDRALDGSELPARFAELANKFLISYINAVDLKNELMETSFIIGTFSVRLGRPVIKQIRYDNGAQAYVATSSKFPKSKSRSLNRCEFVFIGDCRHQFYDELSAFINFKTADKFDMEPFLALSKMLRTSTYVDRSLPLKGPIGGAPQILKIYPFFRCVEFGVHWPSRNEGNLYINGRHLFEYEKITVPQIDSTTLEMHYPLEDLT